MFINDIFAVDDIADVSINGISDISEIQICEINEETNQITNIERVSTEVAGKGSPLSTEFLEYLKGKRWELKGKHLEFNLDEWDFNKPFMRTNPISVDIMALFNAFKAFIHAPKESTAVKITDFKTVEAASVALCHLLASKLKINFTHVEVFIKPLMAKGDGYMLPRPDDEFRFISIKEAIQNRGMGNALGFQEQHHLLTDPEAYNRAHKELPGSALDDLWSTDGLMPE